MSRILFLHKGGSAGIRGTEATLIHSIECLNEAGYRIAFARNLPVIDHLVDKHVDQIIDLDFGEIFINGLRTRAPIARYTRSFLALARTMRKFKPVLLYASAGLPCQLAVPLGRVFRVPVLCHLHHPATKRYYYCWLVPWADRHIFPSRFTRSDIQRKIGVTGNVVYNGIDTTRFRPAQRDQRLRASLGIASDSIVIGQVAALIQNKRPALLLKAFVAAKRVVPRLHLCLVGRGPLENELRGLIKRLELEQAVTVTGYVDDTLPYYQHVFDINALVSAQEGLGISILEGAACSLPALIADCTGLKETAVPSVTGVAFPPDDESALVDAMVALATDAPFRKRAGAAGRAWVEQRFSLRQYQKGIVAAVEAVLGREPARPFAHEGDVSGAPLDAGSDITVGK